MFTLDEMIELFDIADVNQSASTFNPEKLLWINQQHIIAMPAEELARLLMPFLVRAGLDPSDGPDPVHVAEAYHERAETLLHMAASARYCYEDFEVFDEKSAKKHLRPVILEPLRTIRDRLAALEHWGRIADRRGNSRGCRSVRDQHGQARSAAAGRGYRWTGIPAH